MAYSSGAKDYEYNLQLFYLVIFIFNKAVNNLLLEKTGALLRYPFVIPGIDRPKEISEHDSK